jgi:hypothetical protein
LLSTVGVVLAFPEASDAAFGAMQGRHCRKCQLVLRPSNGDSSRHIRCAGIFSGG